MKKLRMLMKMTKNEELLFSALLRPLMMVPGPHCLKPGWRLEGAAKVEGELKDAPDPFFVLPRPRDCYRCFGLCQKMVDNLMGRSELRNFPRSSTP